MEVREDIENEEQLRADQQPCLAELADRSRTGSSAVWLQRDAHSTRRTRLGVPVRSFQRSLGAGQ